MGVNSFLLSLSLPSLPLVVLLDHSLGVYPLDPLFSPPLAWLPLDYGLGLEESPLLYSTKDSTIAMVVARFGHHVSSTLARPSFASCP